MADRTRGQRLQIMLTSQELRNVDDWQFTLRMPSRTAAVRALLKLGLASEGVDLAPSKLTSTDFSLGDSEK